MVGEEGVEYGGGSGRLDLRQEGEGPSEAGYALATCSVGKRWNVCWIPGGACSV